eukprot:16445158-Heterocapsa_arctica.AAC.1
MVATAVRASQNLVILALSPGCSMNRDWVMDSSHAVLAIRTRNESMKGEGSSAILSMLSRNTRLEAFCWLVTIILRSVKQNSHNAV